MRKDFDLDELTRVVELAVLGAVGKDRATSAYRAAFPRGLSALVGLRGKAQKAAERAAKTALVDEQIARAELVRQLHSNRGALRALYPRNARRVASYFPPSHSRAAREPDAADMDEAPVEATAG